MTSTTGVLGGIAIGVLAILLIGGLVVAGMYNSLVNADVGVEAKWGNVQSAYQRRADLIPNLVETVKGARDFEQQTQTEIAAMRSQAGQVKQQVADAKTPEDLQAAEEGMTSVLSRLMLVVEAYPDLKATQNFQDLQVQLEGTENRIQAERNYYNEAVQGYKLKVRSFPTNMLAGMFGFESGKWSMFQANETAQNAPNVDFGS